MNTTLTSLVVGDLVVVDHPGSAVDGMTGFVVFVIALPDDPAPYFVGFHDSIVGRWFSGNVLRPAPVGVGSRCRIVDGHGYGIPNGYNNGDIVEVTALDFSSMPYFAAGCWWRAGELVAVDPTTPLTVAPAPPKAKAPAPLFGYPPLYEGTAYQLANGKRVVVEWVGDLVVPGFQQYAAWTEADGTRVAGTLDRRTIRAIIDTSDIVETEAGTVYRFGLDDFVPVSVRIDDDPTPDEVHITTDADVTSARYAFLDAVHALQSWADGLPTEVDTTITETVELDVAIDRTADAILGPDDRLIIRVPSGMTVDAFNRHHIAATEAFGEGRYVLIPCDQLIVEEGGRK